MTLMRPNDMIKPLDRAFALEAMRAAFNALPIEGTVVIGEGERDEAPILFIGEKVGCGGMAVDIALDPLAAKAMPNALAVMAMAESGTMLRAPDTYMDKIAIRGGHKDRLIDLDAEPGDNINALARSKGVKPQDLIVCVMDRPRHETLIAKIRKAGAAVALIGYGDIAAMIATTNPATGIDMYMGQGGAAEGVLAAAALRCIGGQMQGRLVFRTDEERRRAETLGIADFERKYAMRDLVSGDVVFSTTGVTDGWMLKGVGRYDDHISTESMVMRSATGTVRTLKTRHRQSLV